MSWTDERVELLKKLWQDGLSASQIAGELGGITRNRILELARNSGIKVEERPFSITEALAADAGIKR